MGGFIFKTYPVQPSLQNTVERIWYARGVTPAAAESILPTASASLLVNLGDPHSTSVNGRDPVLLSDSWVCGPQRRPLVSQVLGETHVVGVTFRPGGAAPFLGVPLSSVSDRIVTLEELWGARARQVRDRIGDAATPDAALGVANELLEGWRPPRTMDPDPRWHLAVHALADSNVERVATVASQLGLSVKRFSAELKTRIGMPPKYLHRVARLYRVLGQIGRKRSTLAALAHDHGYTDQAHLNKDFRLLTGVNPTTYLRRRAVVYGDELEPTESTNFLPLDAPG